MSIIRLLTMNNINSSHRLSSILNLALGYSKQCWGIGTLVTYCTSTSPALCIVGSGPSAFYTAQFILRNHKSVRIDMFEKMPAPFGLVRYGVAPDHPEVKNVINTFTEVAQNPRFNFLGNVCVGSDVSLPELREFYAAVILAYGASVDRKLNIPGEDLNGVLSAKDLVGWYNGSPDHMQLNPKLDCETVAVVGMGNVAIDVARILLSPIDRLKSTDIPEPVMAALSASRVRRVVILGRRGPLQAAFTIKEIRELSRLKVDSSGDSPLCLTLLPIGIVQSILQSETSPEKFLASLPRPRRRLTELLLALERENRTPSVDSKQCDLWFLRSPVRIYPEQGSSNVCKMEIVVNRLINTPGVKDPISEPDPSAPSEFLDCGLVVRSVGYRSFPIDPTLPFDHDRGVIRTKDSHGRVADVLGEPANACPLYCTGWVKRGAVGVIVDTAVEARDTGQAVLVDLASAQLSCDPKVVNKRGYADIIEILQNRGVQIVSFADWQRVDAVERSSGKALGKPREKLTSVKSMLMAAFARVAEQKRGH